MLLDCEVSAIPLSQRSGFPDRSRSLLLATCMRKAFWYCPLWLLFAINFQLNKGCLLSMPEGVIWLSHFNCTGLMPLTGFLIFLTGPALQIVKLKSNNVAIANLADTIIIL